MNKQARPQRTININKIFVLMIIALLAAVLGSAVLLFSVGNRLVEQYVTDVGNSALFYFQESLDSDLASITEFCQNNLSNTSLTHAYKHSTSKKESLELQAQLRQLLQQLMQQHKSLRLVIYTPKRSDGALRQADFPSLSDADRLEQLLAQYPMTKNTWHWYDIDDAYYLCNSYEFSDSYCTVCLDTSILRNAPGGQTDIHLICEQDGVYIGNDSNIIDVSQSKLPPMYLFSGSQQLLLSQSSAQGDFQVCCLVYTAKSQLQQTLRFAFLTLAILISLSSLALFLLARHVKNCLQILDAACTQIGSGNLDMRITQNSWLTEAMHIFGTVNTMSEQLQRLKIAVYEHQLSEERAKMSLLRTRIKSHFFINCLNIIYSLATIGNGALIKEFSLCLVNYFRYLGSGFQDTVPLGSELHHLKNYIRIFEIRYPDRVFCRWSVEPDLEDAPILPMILQTFVENIFTHALQPGKQIHIHIRAEHRQQSGRPYVWLQVSDDGPGFPASVLSAPQGNEDPPAEASAHGNGIRNVQQRLDLYYRDCASLRLQNTDEGAQVTLLYPRTEGPIPWTNC